MGFFQRTDESQMMGSFILSEIRDMRKGIEGRDSELRGEIAAVRDAVATLSESVSNSHSNVRAVRADVDGIVGDIKSLRRDVDSLKNDKTITEVKAGSAWDGPKRILTNIAMIGGGAAGILAIMNLWPRIAPLLGP